MIGGVNHLFGGDAVVLQSQHEQILPRFRVRFVFALFGHFFHREVFFRRSNKSR